MDLRETPDPSRVVWAGVQGLAALLVLGLFLLGLGEVLNPFVLFLLLLAVLLPFRRLPGHTLVVVAATVLTLFWVLATTGFLLAPFVLAVVLAYVLDPLVDILERRGVGRNPAILILALPVVAVVVVGVIVGVPALGGQIADLIEQAPLLLQRLADWLEALDDRVAAWRLPTVAEAFVAQLREADPAAMVAFLQERQEEIARRLWQGVLGLGRGLGSVLSIVGYVVLTPVLTFYLLRDWDSLTRSLEELIPRSRREPVVRFARDYDRLLSRYLRGQFTVALIIGAITAAGLAVLGFPYAFLIGVIVALFSVVPYLGLILSLIPALLIALLSGAVAVNLLKVAVVYGAAQALEGAVISPRIVGDSVGLHPVWVVLALAVGGFYFGFVGLLIGVPLAVGAKLIVLEGLRLYRESGLYREAAKG